MSISRWKSSIIWEGFFFNFFYNHDIWLCLFLTCVLLSSFILIHWERKFNTDKLFTTYVNCSFFKNQFFTTNKCFFFIPCVTPLPPLKWMTARKPTSVTHSLLVFCFLRVSKDFLFIGLFWFKWICGSLHLCKTHPWFCLALKSSLSFPTIDLTLSA